MDAEIAAAVAAITASLLSGGIVALLKHPEDVVLVGPSRSITVDTAMKLAVEHVHEASHANAGGWFCDCGAHYHSYVFGIADSEERTCQCGAVGIGKAWA